MRTCLWACPLTPTPQPHHPSPCLCNINMRGSSKVARIDAIRTTRYSLILILCCEVFIFVVKQGVPSDEDLEWPYPSCLLYGKEFFLELFAKQRYKWQVTKSVYVAMTIFCSWQKKKKNLPFAYMGVYISCKIMHSRMHIAEARSGL